MPQIPIYEPRVGIDGQLAAPRRSDVGVTGTGFKALGATLSRLSEIGVRLEAYERQSALNTAKVRSQQAIDETVFQLENDTDYQTQLERYQEKVKAIKTTYSESLGDDPDVQRLWESAFTNQALDGSIKVRRHALEGRLNQQKAGLDDRLLTYTAEATGENPAMDRTLKQAGMEDINAAEQSGVLSPTEAQAKREAFNDDIIAGQIRYDLRDNPELAIEKLQAGEYGKLSGEARNIWIERAVKRSEALEAKRVADENRRYILEERREREIEEAAAKEGHQLIRDGELTTEWINDNADRLSPSDQKYFYDEVSGEVQAETDPAIYSDLRVRAGEGEDVRTEARQALQNHSLQLSDYNKIVTAVESNTVVGQAWYHRGVNYIRDALKPSDLNPDPAAPIRQARALDDWQQWSADHPEATVNDARNAYKQLVEDYSIVNQQEMTLTMPKPRYLIGTRNQPNLEETDAATVDAYNNGEISYEEAQRQARLINEWREALQTGVNHGGE